MKLKDWNGVGCRYDLAYRGRCTNTAVDAFGLCDTHRGIKCISCGEPASEECDHTGQFVCGYPLCDNCEGWNDESKASGAWGFMNHSHRRVAAGAAPKEGK